MTTRAGTGLCLFCGREKQKAMSTECHVCLVRVDPTAITLITIHECTASLDVWPTTNGSDEGEAGGVSHESWCIGIDPTISENAAMACLRLPLHHPPRDRGEKVIKHYGACSANHWSFKPLGNIAKRYEKVSRTAKNRNHLLFKKKGSSSNNNTTANQALHASQWISS